MARKVVRVDLAKLMKLKPLVDDGTLTITEVCQFLGISSHMYRKFINEMNAMNEQKEV